MFEKGNQYGKLNKGRKFTKEHRRKKSEAQMGDKNPNWRGGLIKLKCQVCDGLFEVIRFRRDRAKCCSLRCLGIYNSIMNSGENHYNWKGGRTIIHDRLRRSQKYRIWRKQVFERDNYRCQQCDKPGPGLQPHHVHPFEMSKIVDYLQEIHGTKNLFREATNFELLWNPSIGKTLCIGCHKQTDNYLNRHYKYEN
jgi:5-methylcytosine-specific restriction endonuclease McrA